MFFSVNTKIDRKCLREIFWDSLIEGGAWRLVRTSIEGGIGIFLICSGIFLLAGTSLHPCFFLGISFAISAVFVPLDILVFAPMLITRRNIKSFKKTYGTTAMHITLRFYEDRIERDCKEKQDTKVTFYDSITSYKETKRYILLEVAQESYIHIIDKYSFTKGTIEEFIPFIRSKIHSCSK